jgi:hypothetical protein
MSVTAALAAGRQARLQLMRDTCAVRRVTGRVFDPDDGEYVDTYTDQYTGIADVKPLVAGSQDVEAGEREVVLRRYDVALPYTVAVVFAVDDIVVATASDDATLVGRPLTVVGVQYGPRRTAHHLTCEDRS